MTAQSAVGGGRQTYWWLVLLQGIAALILGILLLTNPAATAVILVQFLGIWWFVGGLFDIVGIFLDRTAWGWKLFSGILGIIAGLLILNHPLWATVLIPTTLVLIVGIFGIVIGIVSLIRAFQGAGWGTGVLGVLSILFGLVLVANPLLAAIGLPWVLGIFGIVGGFAAIVMAFRLRS